MAKRKKASKKPSQAKEKALDRFSQKRGRGRPPTVRFTEIVGRADNYRWILDQVWESLWPLLSNSNGENEVTKAFQDGASPYATQFVPAFSALILGVLREKTFPKRRKPQTNFLADSLAGLGIVTARRSRDICAVERARAKHEHHILRYEYFVECSCGYKGTSKDHACRKCGAKINQAFPQLNSRM
jgi:hypothetical protein